MIKAENSPKNPKNPRNFPNKPEKSFSGKIPKNLKNLMGVQLRQTGGISPKNFSGGYFGYTHLAHLIY